MDAIERRLRELMDAAAGEPPRQISVGSLRRRVFRRRAAESVAGVAAVAVVAVAAVLIPVGFGARHAAGPDGRYGLGGRADVVPVSTATNTAGKPIELARPDNPGGGQIVITPDGKTAYVLAGTYTVHPIATASNLAGPPIQLKSHCHGQGSSAQAAMAITPDGKTVYLACQGAVVPISTASNLPGKPIRVPPGYPMAMAIKP
jgi:DNA-binding beta-propeller fold protein YncE